MTAAMIHIKITEVFFYVVEIIIKFKFQPHEGELQLMNILRKS